MSNFNDTQNKQIVTTAIDELKLNPLTDAIPRQVIPTIQPTFELKRRYANIVKTGTRTSSGSATVYTTPSDKDFYLTGVQMSWSKDVTNDGTTASLQVTIDGDSTASNILRLYGQSVTANQIAETMSFLYPIKLARNSTITINQTYTAGASSLASTITGYTEDVGPQYI